MKIAILLRGFHYITKETNRQTRHRTSPTVFDFREVSFSFITQVYQPLLEKQHTIDIYIITYHSKIEESLKYIPGIKNIKFSPNDSTQFQTFKEGIKSIPDEYELYLITRFDLFYKQNLEKWFPKEIQLNEPVLYAGFKETLNAGNAGGIGDCFFLFTQKGKKLLEEYLNETKTLPNFHKINKPLSQKGMHVKTLFDGHFDSNTSFDTRPDCKNPLYIMWDRPYHHKDIPDKP